MTSKFSAYVMIVTFVSVASSCQKNDAEPISTDPVTVNLEPYYSYDPDPTGSYSNNDVILGRVLFYDKRLSFNNSVSCASCHKQSLGFGDSSAVSTGINNHNGFRNAIAIQNVVPVDNPFSSAFLFWDGREVSLDKMVTDPIFNPYEMGQKELRSTANKLNQFEDYKQVIRMTYDDGRVLDEQTIAHALGAFVSKIRSDRSRGDEANTRTNVLTQQEEAGKTLFFTKYNCGTCHQRVRSAAVNPVNLGYGDGSVTNSDAINFVNIGLDAVYSDQGRGAFTGNPADDGRFRIPDLHNVAVTAPYMHDGRFKTLDEVLEHYSSGIVDHPNLDLQLRDSVTLQPRKMNISTDERLKLIAFLKTLTDSAAMKDPKFSDPFVPN